MSTTTTSVPTAPAARVTATTRTFLGQPYPVVNLLLSPVSLAISTRLAPAAFPSQIVSPFLLSITLETMLSGVVSSYYADADQAGYFAALGNVAVAIGLGLAVLAPWIDTLTTAGSDPTAPVDSGPR